MAEDMDEEMACCLFELDSEYGQKIGLKKENFQNTNLAKIDEKGTIHFFPTQKKGKFYLEFCCKGKNKSKKENEIKQIIQNYTNQTSLLCTKVNLLLAADSPELVSQGAYINDLRWAIGKLANVYPVVDTKECYRGMHCSLEEFNSYIKDKCIYIPSFLSTSRNPQKCYLSDKQNTLIVIKIRYKPGNAFEVNAQYSQFYDQDEEVLFSCYSKFKVLNKSQNYYYPLTKKLLDFYIELEHINDKFFITN